MADEIRQMVAIRRELISGSPNEGKLHKLIARYADANLYKRATSTLERLERDIRRELAKELLPEARVVGKQAARPILDVLKGAKLTEKGSLARGRAIRLLRSYSAKNMAAFEAELAKEVGTLGGEIHAAFARARRDGVVRKDLIADLVRADRGELERLADARGEIQDTAEDLAEAESKLAKAGKRTQRRRKRELGDAKKEHGKAKAKVGTAKTFYARFETAIQGHARDAIRREAETAQQAAFRSVGYRTYTWIAVNSGDACPQCEDRHGKTLTDREWDSEGRPGDGSTYCGSSCMCALVPESYTVGRSGLGEPLRLSTADRLAARPRAGDTTNDLTPIKLGGRNAELAKKARQRMETKR